MAVAREQSNSAYTRTTSIVEKMDGWKTWLLWEKLFCFCDFYKFHIFFSSIVFSRTVGSRWFFCFGTAFGWQTFIFPRFVILQRSMPTRRTARENIIAYVHCIRHSESSNVYLFIIPYHFEWCARVCCVLCVCVEQLWWVCTPGTYAQIIIIIDTHHHSLAQLTWQNWTTTRGRRWSCQLTNLSPYGCYNYETTFASRTENTECKAHLRPCGVSSKNGNRQTLSRLFESNRSCAKYSP